MRTTRTILRRLSLFTLIVCGAVACRERDRRIDEPLDVLGPVSIAGGLMYTERSRSLAFFVDLSDDRGLVRTAALGHDPVVLAARPGQPEAVVLSRGERGRTGVRPEAATVTAVPAAPGVAARTYTVGSPFNAMALTDDGRFALVYFRPETAMGRLLFNPNEIAVVDLQAPAGPGNPVLRTVRSFGGIPNSVVFSPPISIRGERRTIAVVLSDAYVTLIDLNHLDRSEVSVRLTLPEDPRAIGPQQVLFDVDDPTLYIRASASNDVYVVRLNETMPDGPTGNDFRPTINQLGAGREPADMALFGAGAARRLLVVSRASQEVRVVDARSNAIAVVPLDARADRVLMFEGPAPHDTVVARRALLYSADASASAVTFLDLGDVEQRRGQNVETIQLGRAIRVALPLPDRNAVMFEHVETSSAGRLSLLDLHRRTASPIFAEVSLQGAQFDGDRQLLWVAPQTGTRLGYIDLRSYHPGEVRLDANVSSVVPIVGDPMGRNRVAALHNSAGGHLTVIDGADPLRDTAFALRGFVLTGVLDREAP